MARDRKLNGLQILAGVLVFGTPFLGLLWFPLFFTPVLGIALGLWAENQR